MLNAGRSIFSLRLLRILRATAIFLLLTALTTRADDAFTQANKLYEQGKYPEAAAAYDTIIQTGTVSPAIYFNLGNAAYKASQPGRAIHAYRQAETLAPRDPNIHANLQFARTHANAGAPALPGNRWTKWITKLSLDEWTILASLSVAAFFLLLAARQIWPASKKTFTTPALIVTALSLWFLACLAVDWNQTIATKTGVVITAESVVRRGPFEESQSAFTAHDGAELIITDQKEKWLQVLDSQHRTGWLQDRDLALIK